MFRALKEKVLAVPPLKSKVEALIVVAPTVVHVRPAIVKAPPDPLTAIVFAVAAELGDLVAPLHTSPVADEAFPLRAPEKVVVDKVFELGLYVIPASYKTCWAVVLALSRKATYWPALVALAAATTFVVLAATVAVAAFPEQAAAVVAVAALPVILMA